MARTISEKEIIKFDPTNIEDLTPVLVDRKFGRPEDYIEIYISDLNNNILDYIPNFKNYKIPSNNPHGTLTNEFDLDPQSILEGRGYYTGIFKLHVNIQKRKIFNELSPPFRIQEISSDRTELKLYSLYSNTLLRSNSRKFISDVQDSLYFRDFTLNFGDNVNLLGVNVDLDTTDNNQYLLLIKLFKPLPDNISEGASLSIVEDITDPIVLTYDLGIPPPIDTSIPIRGPNFKIDTRLNGSVPTAYKSYDDILKTESTSSYQKLLSKLDGYEIPEIDYSYVRPVPTASIDFLSVTPSHFENFVHFGSATERLKNFEYKLKLIEVYNKQLEEIRTITGTTANSSVVLNSTSSIELKKENLIQGLDGYEQFLYFESGAYSWPKSNSIEPYLLEPTTSPTAQTWLGSGDSFNSYYGGQLLSASTFDSQNPNRLFKLTPTFIGDNPTNQPFELFCDMVGTHFDPIWAHTKEIAQIRDNSHKYGVSKDLVYHALQSLGIEAYDQFENSDLIDYVFGKTFTTTDTATVITASNEIFSKQDISKEVWKRLYHNAPYLLKTKGTERGLRALINCYGIPDTILDIKEYGSSHPDRDEFKLYTYSKFTKAIDGHSRDAEGFFIETNWSSSFTEALSASAKTVEFRINPNKTNLNQHLLTLSGSISSSDLHLLLEEYGEGENLVKGSSMGELPITHYWVPYTGGGTPPTSERSTEQAYTDSFSYKSVTTGNNQGIITSSPYYIPVVSGSTYVVDYWYYPEAGGSQPFHFDILWTQVVVAGIGGPGNDTDFFNGNYYSGENVANFDQWNNVKKHFKALKTGNVYLRIDQGDGVGGTSYVDHVRLYELSSDRKTKDFYEVGDNTKFARLNLHQFTSSIATTDYFPAFDEDFWQIFVGTDGASGSDATIKFGAYQANHLREVDFYTSSIAISERQNSEVWGNRFYNGLREEELTTDGGFTDASNWTLTDNGDALAAITGNAFVSTNPGSTQGFTSAAQAQTLIAGKTYRLTFDVTAVTGNVTIYNYSDSQLYTIGTATVGTFTHDFISDGTGGIDVRSVVDAGESVTIDNISVKEINPKSHTGADICYFGGVRNIFNSTALIAANAFTSSNYFATTPTTEYTGSAFDLDFSGSLSEVRIYKGELLSHDTLKKHALEPLMYAGNTITSSYDGLVLRLPLSFELELTANTSSQMPSGSMPMLNGGLGGVGGSGATGTAWNQSPNSTGLISPPIPLTGPITGGAILDSSGNPATVGSNYSGQYFSSGSVPTYSNGAPMFTVSGIPLLRSHHPNEKIDYLDGFTFFENDNIILLEEEHHLPTPNTIGKSPINKKIRIDSVATDDDILSPDISSQLPSSLVNVPDFDAISVFLSPQNEINEDIIYTLGTFSLDEFLGDPRDQTLNSWPQIEILKNHYFRKLEKGSQKQNIFDFTRWVQFIDHTLFDLIKQFVPQKSTTKTGLLIEPHYLERAKFQRFHPSQSNHVYDSTIQEVTASFHKNSNTSQLNNTSGSAVISHTTIVTSSNLGYNTTISPVKHFSGSSAWEQGPLKSQYPLFLDFNHYADGVDVGGSGTVDGLSNFYTSGGATATIDNKRLKITKLGATNNTGAVTNDIGVKVGKRYRFSLDTTENPGNVTFYHGTKHTQLANNSGYSNNPVSKNSKNEAGATISANTVATGSISLEFIPTLPFLRIYFRPNINNSNAGTTFFDNIILEELDFKQINSSGSNELRPWALTPQGNFLNSRVSRKRFKSDKAVSSSGNVEFDDSLIDMASWKLPRYEGSKLIGAKINEYTVGDISYGLNPVINQNVSALFYGQSIIGADGEDDSLTTIKNHSYLDIEKIILINKYSDKITTIDLKNEKYKGTNGYISNAFKDGSSFNIHLVDDKITHKLKDTYKSKFSQGYLYKILEHKGHNGSGNIAGEGIQVGYVDDYPSGFPYATSTSQNVLCYGKDNSTINNSTVVLKENRLTKKIWPQNQTFGRVDFITSSLNNHYYSSWDNLGMFVNSMLIPVASESKHRLFGTFNLGQPLQIADYITGSNQGIKSISTAEFDLEAYVVTSSLHDQISGSSNMSGFGRALIRPDHLVIPIMQGHHDTITDKKEGAGVTWPGDGGDTAGSHSGATDIELKYYFSGNANIGSAIYQISYLEETNVVIADLDKPIELANDLGDKGFILIPDNLDKDIKANLDFFLNKAGYKEGSSPERIANRKE